MEHQPISPIEHDSIAATAAAHEALAAGEPLLVVAGGTPAQQEALARALSVDRLACGEDVLDLDVAEAPFSTTQLAGHLAMPDGLPDAGVDAALTQAVGTYRRAETRLVVLVRAAERLADDGIACIRRLRRADPAAAALSIVLLGNDQVAQVADRLLRPAAPGGLRFVRLSALAAAPRTSLGMFPPAPPEPPAPMAPAAAPARVDAAPPLPTSVHDDVRQALASTWVADLVAQDEQAGLERYGESERPHQFERPGKTGLSVPPAAEPIASAEAGAAAVASAPEVKLPATERAEQSWSMSSAAHQPGRAAPSVQAQAPNAWYDDQALTAPPPPGPAAAGPHSPAEHAADPPAVERTADLHPPAEHASSHDAPSEAAAGDLTGDHQPAGSDRTVQAADYAGYAGEYRDAFAQLAAPDATSVAAPGTEAATELRRSEVISAVPAWSSFDAKPIRRAGSGMVLPLVTMTVVGALVGWFVVRLVIGTEPPLPPGLRAALSTVPPRVAAPTVPPAAAPVADPSLAGLILPPRVSAPISLPPAQPPAASELSIAPPVLPVKPPRVSAPVSLPPPPQPLPQSTGQASAQPAPPPPPAGPAPQATAPRARHAVLPTPTTFSGEAAATSPVGAKPADRPPQAAGADPVPAPVAAVPAPPSAALPAQSRPEAHPEAPAQAGAGADESRVATAAPAGGAAASPTTPLAAPPPPSAVAPPGTAAAAPPPVHEPTATTAEPVIQPPPPPPLPLPSQQAMVQPPVLLPPNFAPTAPGGPSAPAGPGLLVIAKVDDSLHSLYARVYKGLQAPSFEAVAAMNPHDIKLGDVVVFPAPPGGWHRLPSAEGR